VRHSAGLAIVLFVLWLLWSGHYTPFLLLLGLLSCLMTILLSRRMGILDLEGQPLHLLGRALIYWPWLFWQILKANLDVARRILHPKLPIEPQMIQVISGQRTDLGCVIYAQSITLTPGTISLDIAGRTITVHALSRQSAAELQAGTMDRRVTSFEGVR